MSKDRTKILLIYPTIYKKTGLPIGVASLCAVLKEAKYEVKVFDTAFYNIKKEDAGVKIRSDRIMSKEIKNEEIFPQNNADVFDDLNKIIQSFRPTIIGISVLESNYSISTKLTNFIKSKFKDIYIIAGGVFPTLSPEVTIAEKSIDAVCVGEGEKPLLGVCEKIDAGEKPIDIEGLWIKDGDKIIKNNPSILHDLNSLPHPDFTEFNEWLFYKPMQGKLYKMINIDTTRGCPYICTYCAAPMLKNYFNENSSGKYYRKINMVKVIDQIHFQIKRHNPEFIYFSSETFLSMNDKEFEMFVDEYSNIKIPFWFQTRFETITEERMKRLKEIGMYWLTIGLEHGNEEFREKILKRKYSNKMAVDKMKILSNLNIGASINNMMGFPFETRELIFDTINLNKKMWKINNKIEHNIFLLAPFQGSELYNFCIINNLLDNGHITDTTDLADESVLNFPQSFKSELKGLIKTFNLYVKLPEKYYPDIRIAERNDSEGAQMFKKMKGLVPNYIY